MVSITVKGHTETQSRKFSEHQPSGIKIFVSEYLDVLVEKAIKY